MRYKIHLRFVDRAYIELEAKSKKEAEEMWINGDFEELWGGIPWRIVKVEEVKNA